MIAALSGCPGRGLGVAFGCTPPQTSFSGRIMDARLLNIKTFQLLTSYSPLSVVITPDDAQPEHGFRPKLVFNKRTRL